MPFGNITAQTLTYAPRVPGMYSLSTLAFGDPSNQFVVRGAQANAEPLRASVSRVLQKDVTVGGDTVRKSATVTISIVTPSTDFTATEMDSLVVDINEFLTVDTLTRMFMGES